MFEYQKRLAEGREMMRLELMVTPDWWTRYEERLRARRRRWWVTFMVAAGCVTVCALAAVKGSVDGAIAIGAIFGPFFGYMLASFVTPTRETVLVKTWSEMMDRRQSPKDRKAR